MKVTLLKAHQHAGVEYPAGVEIDVPESDAAFLIEHGVIGIGQKHDAEALSVEQAAARQGKRG